MNKKRFYKIIIIVVDIFAVVWILFLWYRWNNMNKISNDEIEKLLYTYEFKDFNFYGLSDTNFKKFDENQFILTSEKYSAIIEIYKDENLDTFNYVDEYSEAIKKNGFTIVDKKIENIKDRSVLIYDIDGNNKMLLCYFELDSPFIVEIELSNASNDFDYSSLNDILSILNTFRYNPNDLKYEYSSTSINDVRTYLDREINN